VSESPLRLSDGEKLNVTFCPAVAGFGLGVIERLPVGGRVGVGVGVGGGFVVVNDVGVEADVAPPHELWVITCHVNVVPAGTGYVHEVVVTAEQSARFKGFGDGFTS
jgi:hypothetical protein